MNAGLSWPGAWYGLTQAVQEPPKESLIAHAKAGFALRWVRLGDHETVVASRGESGPAVLLVHALGLDWRMWDAVMPKLAVGHVRRDSSAGLIRPTSLPSGSATIAYRAPEGVERRLPRPGSPPQ